MTDARAWTRRVVAVAALGLPVVALDDVLVMKLHAFDEHYCDFAGILQSLARCASRSTGTTCAHGPTTSPFARFFTIVEGSGSSATAHRRRSRSKAMRGFASRARSSPVSQTHPPSRPEGRRGPGLPTADG